jgi:hypothetical protein
MPKDSTTKLIAEIKRVAAEIDAQKKLIKENAKDELIVQTAELEMKTLHTRLSGLEASLAKEKSAKTIPR